MFPFPNNSQEVEEMARKNHPTWTDGQITSYLVGYFDSMLDDKGRQEQINKGLQEVYRKRKQNADRL